MQFPLPAQCRSLLCVQLFASCRLPPSWAKATSAEDVAVPCAWGRTLVGGERWQLHCGTTTWRPPNEPVCFVCVQFWLGNCRGGGQVGTRQGNQLQLGPAWLSFLLSINLFAWVRLHGTSISNVLYHSPRFTVLYLCSIFTCLYSLLLAIMLNFCFVS